MGKGEFCRLGGGTHVPVIDVVLVDVDARDALRSERNSQAYEKEIMVLAIRHRHSFEAQRNQTQPDRKDPPHARWQAWKADAGPLRL